MDWADPTLRPKARITRVNSCLYNLMGLNQQEFLNSANRSLSDISDSLFVPQDDRYHIFVVNNADTSTNFKSLASFASGITKTLIHAVFIFATFSSALIYRVSSNHKELNLLAVVHNRTRDSQNLRPLKLAHYTVD